MPMWNTAMLVGLLAAIGTTIDTLAVGDASELGVPAATLVSLTVALAVEPLISPVEAEIPSAELDLPPPDAGVLICDAADETTLASIARQLKVEAHPTRSERRLVTGRSGSISLAFRALVLGGSSTRSAEDVHVFENADDTNVLLRRVLRALDDTGALRRDAEGLCRRWSNVADRALVLVEGPWDVERCEDGLELQLAAVTAKVPASMLLDHRVDALRAGRRMALGVFGQVSRADADDGRAVTLEPIAVFKRLAATG